jgi:hypothetical protein
VRHFAREARDRVERRRDVRGGAVTGRLARHERVIAVLQPQEADRTGEPVARDVGFGAERVACALYDQARGAEVGEVFGPQLVRLLRRVKRVAEAEQPGRSQLVGDHARDPAAHGLATDAPAARLAELAEDRAKRVEQDRQPIRRWAQPSAAALHVRELEAHDVEPARHQARREVLKEGRVEARACAMGEHDAYGCILGAVAHQAGHRAHFPRET